MACLCRNGGTPEQQGVGLPIEEYGSHLDEKPNTNVTEHAKTLLNPSNTAGGRTPRFLLLSLSLLLL